MYFSPPPAAASVQPDSAQPAPTPAAAPVQPDSAQPAPALAQQPAPGSWGASEGKKDSNQVAADGATKAMKEESKSAKSESKIKIRWIPLSICAGVAVAGGVLAAVFDSKWTAEAVGNLLDNAIKYTPSGGAVSVHVSEYDMFCRIDVSDNGLGIPEEEQAKVFQRFYRSPSVADAEGVGIGLYLTRQIITGQGGYIKLTSKPDEGSTFSIFLPRE